MKRRKVLALLAAPLAWLGCNGLLGIDDATYVALPDGSTNGEGDGSLVPIGPIRPARGTVRIPVGETRTLDVLIVPDPGSGLTGGATLTAVVADTAITATVTTSETNRFVVTLVGPASVDDLLDTTLRLEATSTDGTTKMTQNVRLLAGRPGRIDSTFGTGGSVIVENAIRSNAGAVSFPVGLLDYTVVVGDGVGRFYLFDNDGASPRTVDVLRPDAGCSIDALASAPGVVVSASRCTGDIGGAVGYAVASGPVPQPQELAMAPVVGVALTRSFAHILAGTQANRLLTVNGQIDRSLVNAIDPSIFAAEDAVVTVGTRTVAAGAELLFEYTPVDMVTGQRGGVSSTFVRSERDASASASTAGGTRVDALSFAAAWSVSYPGAPQGQGDVSVVYVLGPDGGVQATRRFFAVTTRLAGDARGRIFVATDDADFLTTTLRRVLKDGTDDPAFPETGVTCHFPGLVVDPDGMVVLSCEDTNTTTGKLVVQRYWP